MDTLNVILQENASEHYIETKVYGVITSVLNGKPRHSERGVRSECQEETVTAALYSLRGLVALKTG